jgi:hypothetical protein
MDCITVRQTSLRSRVTHLIAPHIKYVVQSWNLRLCNGARNFYVPVSLDRLTESELWMLRLGTPGEDQLDLLPGNVTGIPPTFEYHPFRYIDWKEEARVQWQKALKLAERTVDTR